MKKVLLFAFILSLAACTGQVTSKHSSKEVMADSLSKTDLANATNNELTKMYRRAISDYISEVAKQNLMVFDTLYFGKRNNGQPDDFPDITLPETINNIQIRLIDPEVGKRLQEEKKSSVYINLIGWVEKDKSEFVFVTFSNGFEHKFDCYINYQYNSDRMEHELTTSRIEKFSKN